MDSAKQGGVPILEKFSELAEDFAERAQQVDRSFQPPRQNMEELARAGYFQAMVELEDPLRRRLLDRVSSGCGATAFLASQHVGACRRLALKNHELLSQALNGEVWVGVCFAHLRRRPSPVCVRWESNSLVFSGHGPWFSGLGLMERVLVAGATEDGDFLMAQTPLEVEGLEAGEAPVLAVMNATSTVPLTFDGLRIPKSELVLEFDAQRMNSSDRHSTVDQSARSLGVARAAARFLEKSERESLLGHIERLHQDMDSWEHSLDWLGAVQLRKKAVQLAGLAVQTAFVTVGGRSHSLDHPVQRLAREASFYSTAQLTTELRQAFQQDVRDLGQSSSLPL